jgi:hypothetical protein
MGPMLREGDKVYLIWKNIRTKQPSDKLDHKKLGPFKVQKIVGLVNYKLALPKIINIHPIFHVLLLKPAPPGAPRALNPEIQLVNPEAKYKVKEILDCKFFG